MKIPLLAVLVLSASMLSCDRAGKLVDKAKSTVSGKSAKEEDKAEEEEAKPVPMDPALAKLVDRTDEGVLFRRDLPFPKEVGVVITEKEPMGVRLFQQSEVSKQATSLSLIRKFSMEIKKTPEFVRFSGFKESFADTTPTTGDAAPVPQQRHPLQAPVSPKDVTLVLRKDKWSAGGTPGFAELAFAQQMGPQMSVLMQEYGLSPRPLWFGKRRIVPGKPIEISGELLPMLVAGKATGELTITLEDIESVHGHPCGRFSIKGSYQRKGFPFLDGRQFNEETSILSGHIWMSVLHPLVLQYRTERIVTLSIAEGTGPAIRYQGNTSPLRSIAWQAVE